jgi:hypothetical protein
MTTVAIRDLRGLAIGHHITVAGTDSTWEIKAIKEVHMESSAPWSYWELEVELDAAAPAPQPDELTASPAPLP